MSLKIYIPFFDHNKLMASLSQVKSAEIILLYRQLAMLLDSGTDIAASLDLLQDQSTNPALKKVLEGRTTLREINKVTFVE